jgi:hypothetical protein
MKKFEDEKNLLKGFSGVCKLCYDESIRYYQNGLIHRNDGPAVISENGDKYWFYKNTYYGVNDEFTNETWKEKVQYLKREEELKIFK